MHFPLIEVSGEIRPLHKELAAIMAMMGKRGEGAEVGQSMVGGSG